MRIPLPRLMLVGLAVCAAAGAAASPAAAGPGLIVVPHPASGAALSYFSLEAQPGSSADAGTIELHNAGARELRVAIQAVNGRTLDTLGSGYGTTSAAPAGSTGWLHFGTSRVTLAPGATTSVPVTVSVPADAQGGEHLSGVSVEALGQDAASSPSNGVSVASAQRYAIGVVTKLPGALHAGIHFTGAGVEDQPAGVVFAIRAANDGNAIVKGVHGSVRITREGKLVASQAIAPGTFVSHTSIAYPVPTSGQRPPEGTSYLVTATLVYPGGEAHLTKTVTFGEEQAHVQAIYGRSSGSGPFGSLPLWAVLGFALVVIYAAATTTVLLRRRRRATDPGT